MVMVLAALANVTAIWVEEVTSQLESAALVAVTKHVPVLVTLNTPALMEHPEAVPPALRAYDTAPVPDPPLLVRVRPVP
jgi:hypothetical protein